MNTTFQAATRVLTAALETPWRAFNELRRILAVPSIRLRFRLHGVTWGRGWRVFGMPIIQRFQGSRIELGDGIDLRSWQSSNPLAPNHPVVFATRANGASIVVGRDCGFTGTSIVAAESICIGDRVLVGANSTIADTDFHPLDPAARARDILAGAHAPVVIEDDVFIGMHCLILKGVHIGRGAMIGAGSVVSRDVPAGMIAAGNPARVLRAVCQEGAPNP